MPDSVALLIFLELVAIVGLLSLNGLFALSEIAVVSANRTRLQQLADKNNRARSVIQLAEDPTAFLSTVQIGITLIGILAGALSGATLSAELGALLAHVSWLANYAEVISFAVVVVFVTLLSLLIGELIPKSIALSNPEQFAMAVAPMMKLLARVTAPIVRMLSLITESTLRLLQIEPNQQPPITEEEMKTLLTEGMKAGIFEPLEEQIVTQALELDDVSLRPVLTHRTQVIWLDMNHSASDWLQTIAAHPFNAFPVCDGSMDRTLGVLYARDLLLMQIGTSSAEEAHQHHDIDMGKLVQPVLFVPLTASPSSLLTHFQNEQAKMIFAVDEYGGTEGIVTQSDVMALLMGSVEPLDGGCGAEPLNKEDPIR